MRERIDAIDLARRGAGYNLHQPRSRKRPGKPDPPQFGFSDSAEAFVFLSDLSVALAYRKRFESQDLFPAVASVLKRALRLYQVHLILTVAALMIFGFAAAVTGHEALLGEHGRGTPFSDPLRGMIGILMLTHQIGYFNILPLYVALMTLTPALFVVGVHAPWKMLGLSAALYAATRAFGINVPSWPDEGFWYFNPLAWQLLFALGMFCGFTTAHRDGAFGRLIYWLSHPFTLIAAVIVSNGLGLTPGLVDTAGEYLDWDKTQLGAVRIVDFLALAYVIYFSGITARLRGTRLYPAASLLGRHALPVYCLGSVLSAFGRILNETWMASPILDVLFVGLGLKWLHSVAAMLEKRSDARLALA